MQEETFLWQMGTSPDDDTLRLAFADWLEERDDPRGELVHLLHTLTRPEEPPDRLALELRLRALLAKGTRPVGPRWTNSIGMQLTWVPPGSFRMGSPPNEDHRQDDELAHRVRLTRGFYMSVSPVTQAQWELVMGTNPSGFPGGDRPVECVSWEDCQEFCRLLARKDGLAGDLPTPYRLPTEAEWEYACRAGTSTAFTFGPSLATSQANYHANYAPDRSTRDRHRRETTPVGTFPANAWGLTDLHGNVFEWCSDWYWPYPPTPEVDPQGRDKGKVRIVRGGSWNSLSWRCRSSCRGWGLPDYRGSDVGCRVCFRLESDYVL